MTTKRLWQGWQSDEGGWKTAILLVAWSAFFIFVLSSCATPAVKERVVTVNVPVAVQPIKPADVPVLPAPLPKRPADARQALDLALSKVCEWVAFGLRAQPLLQVSSGQAQQAVPAYPECGEH